MSNDFKYQYLTGAARLVFYFVVSLALFFGAAVLIFILRGSTAQLNEMPDVTGKYYVDVHEDLTTRMQLRVRLEKRTFSDRPSGLVLYQSVAPGALIEPQEKVQLIVNQPDPLLTMPDLRRQSLLNAEAALERVTGEERVYRLKLAAVSEVERSDVPSGTVLEQFPPPGRSVTPGEPVYLLIARESAGPVSEESVDSWVGQNITILSSYLNRRGVEYRLGELSAPPSPDANGVVHAVHAPKSEAGPYLLDVYYVQPEQRYGHGYEAVEVELSDAGDCRAERSTPGLEDQDFVALDPGDESHLIFRSARAGDDENVRLIFYRSGINRVRVACGDDVVYDRTFRPDYPG